MAEKLDRRVELPVVTRKCLFDGASLNVSADVFDKSGEPRQEYRGKDVPGAYIGGAGGVYCDGLCWTHYCED